MTGKQLLFLAHIGVTGGMYRPAQAQVDLDNGFEHHYQIQDISSMADLGNGKLAIAAHRYGIVVLDMITGEKEYLNYFNSNMVNDFDLYGISADGSGGFWAANCDVYHYANDTFQIFNSLNSTLQQGMCFRETMVAKDGSVYVSYNNQFTQKIEKNDHGTWSTINGVRGPFLAEDTSGKIYTGSISFGFFQIDGVTINQFTTSNSSLPSNQINDMVGSPDGGLWISHGMGLSYFNGGFTNYDTSNSGLSSNVVSDLAIDSIGTLYITQPGHGFTVFDGSTWANYDTSNSGIHSDSMGHPVIVKGITLPGPFKLGGSVSPVAVFACAQAGHDGIITATDLAQYIPIDVSPSPIRSNQGRDITGYYDQSGTLHFWEATDETGLAHHVGNTHHYINPSNSNYPNPFSRAVEYLDGYIYSATSGGVAVVDPNTEIITQILTPANTGGRPMNSINDLAADPLNGCLWFATSNGAYRLCGSTWTDYTTATGLLDNNCSGVAVNPVTSEAVITHLLFGFTHINGATTGYNTGNSALTSNETLKPAHFGNGFLIPTWFDGLNYFENGIVTPLDQCHFPLGNQGQCVSNSFDYDFGSGLKTYAIYNDIYQPDLKVISRDHVGGPFEVSGVRLARNPYIHNLPRENPLHRGHIFGQIFDKMCLVPKSLNAPPEAPPAVFGVTSGSGLFFNHDFPFERLIGGCTALRNYDPVTQTPTIINTPSGPITGPNNTPMARIAEYFNPGVPISNYELFAAQFKWGNVQVTDPDQFIRFLLWDEQGGLPGSILSHKDISICQIEEDFLQGNETYIAFPNNAINANGTRLFVGYETDFSLGNTYTLYTNQDGQTTPASLYEYKNGNWWSFSDPVNSYGKNVSGWITSTVCEQPPACPPPIPSLVSSTPNTSCGTIGNGSITINATGGTPPYTYQWDFATGFQTGQTANNLKVGVYFVTITDAVGCDTVAAFVVLDSLPVITIAEQNNEPNRSCYSTGNGTITVVASGGTPPYSYEWDAATGNQVGPTAVNLSAGMYVVTATDDEGCQGVDTFTVLDSSEVVIMLTSYDANTSCDSTTPNGYLIVEAQGGTPPYTFQWDAGTGSQVGDTASNLAAGVYVVSVTDAQGCTDTAVWIIVDIPAQIMVNIDNIKGNTICDTNFLPPNGYASVYASGGTSPYTYIWDNGQAGETLNGVPAGIYTVTATDANGCEGITTVTIVDNTNITLAILSISDNTQCIDTADGSATVQASGGTPPYAYLWSTGASGSTLTMVSGGSYYVTATDFTGCSVSDSVSIKDPILQVNFDKTPVDTCVLFDLGTLTALPTGGTPPYSYQWSTTPVQTTQMAVDLLWLPWGNYHVTVTDAHGCQVVDSSNVERTSIYSSPVVSLNLLTHVNCYGDSTGAIDITDVSGSSTFEWSNGATTEDISDLPAGTYSVTVSPPGPNICSTHLTFTISEPTQLALNITHTNQTWGGSDGTATANVTGGVPPYSYQWSNSQTTQTITGLTVSTYSVTVTDLNGCTATGSVDIETGLYPVDRNLDLKIYPNPTDGNVTIDLTLPNNNEVYVQFFNALGEAIVSDHLKGVKNLQKVYALHERAAGIYWIRITTADQKTATRKIVLTR